ncbi:MAG: hypothetical protein FWC49_03425 [Proteobacteria bacterium]|nr:hypothetical protein [Pseudomonadota bacterium]
MAAPRIHPAGIGFDFDGVIADTIKAFIRIACEQYGYCGICPEQITTFFVEECVPMEAGLAEAIFLQILRDSVGAGLLPMPGAVEVLAEMTRHGQVSIVTARPEVQPVHAWLRSVFPESVWRRMRVAAVGDHDGKASHIKELGLSAFIDDRAETCMQLHHAGIEAIVFSQPWNQNRHTLPVVRTWADIRDLCL